MADNRKWYLKTYNNLIESARLHESEIIKGIYHVHHIIPRCMGGSDDENNLVKLTIRQHILAHMILSRAYPENNTLLFVATIMTTVKDTLGNTFVAPSRLAAQFSEEYSKRQKGKILSPVTRKKMSISRTGHITTQDTKDKISKSETGKLVPRDVILKQVGKIVPQELREKYKSEVSEDKKLTISKTLKERGDKNKTGSKTVVVDGIEYNSLKDCSEALNISIKEIKRLADTNPDRVIISKSPTSYKIEGPDGTIYNSLNECARKLGRLKKTIRNWILNYPEMGYKLINDFIPKVD